MNFNPRKHKTVHEFVAPSVYILEILRDVCFDSGQLEFIDRIAHSDAEPPGPWEKDAYDEAACRAYEKRTTEIGKGEIKWQVKINQLLDKFIEYHKQNQSKIQVTRIHRDLYGYSIHGPKSWMGIQTFNITFTTEDVRLDFADYFNQHGYGEAIYCFSEKPVGIKKLWKPAT